MQFIGVLCTAPKIADEYEKREGPELETLDRKEYHQLDTTLETFCPFCEDTESTIKREVGRLESLSIMVIKQMIEMELSFLRLMALRKRFLKGLGTYLFNLASLNNFHNLFRALIS